MIVLDASALVELLLNTPTGQTIATRIGDPALGIHIPHLADVEVTQALRRYVQKGELNEGEAAEALAGFTRAWIYSATRMNQCSIACGNCART